MFLELFGDPVGNPMGWDVVKFKEVILTDVDYRGKTPPKSSSGIPLISSANVHNGEIDFNKPSFISEKDYKKWTTRGFCEADDLLFTTEAPVGEVALFPSGKIYQLSRRVIAFRVDKNMSQPIYLLKTMLNENWKNRLFKKLRGSTVPRILKPDITNQEILLPPLKLQNQFAQHIQAIESQKAQAEASLAKAEDLFNSLLQRAFKGELL